MPKYSLPFVTSSIPRDLRTFLERVREAIDSIGKLLDDSGSARSLPLLVVGMQHIASPAAATDYSGGRFTVGGADTRARVLVTNGGTAANITITFGTQQYSYSLAARESASVTIVGIDQKFSHEFLVRTDTAGAEFSIITSVST